MWVEIEEKDSKKAALPPVEIKAEPVRTFECRVIVWKTRDIEGGDFENTADIYCRAFFNPDKDLKTDTHWRANNGNASFNYRLKLEMNTEQKSKTLTV